MHQSNPILDEIHAIREAIAQANGEDLKAIADAARSRQGESGREIVQLPPKRVDSAKRAF